MTPLKWLILAGAFVLIVGVYLFVIAACRVAGQADRELERDIDEQ